MSFRRKGKVYVVGCVFCFFNAKGAKLRKVFLWFGGGFGKGLFWCVWSFLVLPVPAALF